MYLAISATSAPGRQFIVTDPSFLLYAPMIRMTGGEVKFIPTRAENDHQLDPDEVIRAMGSRTFALILRSEEHTSELQSRPHLVCRLLLEKKNIKLNDY